MTRRKIRNEELNRLSVSDYKSAGKVPIVVVLDSVRSLNNVGSAFRTCDAFRVEKIFLAGITGRPPHREIQKTALGATDSVDWEYWEDIDQLSEALIGEGYQIVAVEQVQEGTMLNHFVPDPQEKYALIFGNEVFGVNEGIVGKSDICLEIPQYGTKHSLNISVTIGIVLWDMVSKLGKMD